MNQSISAVISLLIFFPYCSPPSAYSSPVSVELSGYTTKEAEILKDSNFRYFVRALVEIEGNYKHTSKIGRKKNLCGALKGALRFGVDDEYADFIPAEDETEYYRRSIDGETKTTEGVIIEDAAVGWLAVKDKIYFINITEFRSVTITQFDACVVDMIVDKPKGIVLDLRGNGGGGVSAVVDILFYLMNPDCLIATEEWNNGQTSKLLPRRENSYRIRKGVSSPGGFEFLRKIPIVILVDKDTASASEMMASALRDNGRAILVGTKTFGKSIFQDIVINEIGSLKMTTGKWLTPKGVFIHGIGLTPDYILEDTRGNGADHPIDSHLEKALEILSDKTKKVKGK